MHILKYFFSWDQDNGEGRPWAHLPDKYIKTTTTYKAVLTENDLRTSPRALLQASLYTKSYTESGSRVGEEIYLGPTPLAGDLEEERISKARGSSLRSKGFKPHIYYLIQGDEPA